jgi:hypothetical protein
MKALFYSRVTRAALRGCSNVVDGESVGIKYICFIYLTLIVAHRFIPYHGMIQIRRGGGAGENLVNPIKIDGLRGRDLNPEPKNPRSLLVELIECTHSGWEI